MYDSSWEKASRSSHPNLWSPPIVTPIIRGTMSETETDSSREFSLQTTDNDIDRRHQRLPSVDEILLKIRHQETFHPPPPLPLPPLPHQHPHPHPHPHAQPQEVRFIPLAFPQSYQNQEQLNIAHWQRASLRTTDYQFDPRVGFDPPSEDPHMESHPTNFSVTTLSEASSSISRSPQHKSVEGTTAKKRGRKKKSDTICSHCQSTQTPEWRRGPDGSRTLCNACGLFYSKLTKKFGFEDANMIFAYKKRHNEVQDRIVPTMQQKNRYLSESRTE